ncbi:MULTISPECIES: XF1762 family protein [unclassified Streptomyces]|uniref:XF1762 family protein n=1 Tax=unclassified Streptomyces TaxID=2593676 RepID=UPI0018FE490B|nr:MULTISPECIES: XF1762 family protein [unclassified Streptomyces]
MSTMPIGPPTVADKQSRLTIVPLMFAEACEAVDRIHRHHRRPQGHRFSIGVVRPGVLCGVAIVGRPVARAFDPRFTIEVTRVATDGTPNACSALYGAAWRAGSAMGFRRVITYTQGAESGASLRAVGWTPIAVLRPRTGWDTPARRREDRGTDGVARILWQQCSKDAPGLPSIEELRAAIRSEVLCEAPDCGRPIKVGGGRRRPPRYCSPACRSRAYRAAKASA